SKDRRREYPLFQFPTAFCLAETVLRRRKIRAALSPTMNNMNADSATVDSRAAGIVAGASLAILTIAYGAPLLAAVALKPIAAEFGTDRAAPAAAPALPLIGTAFGGIVPGCLSGRLGIRRIVLFGAAMIAAGLVLSASGGLMHLYVGHGLLIGLFGASCIFSPVVMSAAGSIAAGAPPWP